MKHDRSAMGDPDLPVFDRLREMLDAAELCLKSGFVIPALVLLYSLIDSISWLASDNPDEGVKSRFVRWVDMWMLERIKFPCTSLELYGARCGIVHTLTSDSTLSRDDVVRRVCYSFGISATPQDQKAADLGRKDLVVLPVELLYGGVLAGLTAFMEDAMKDPKRMVDIERHGRRHFAFTAGSEIDRNRRKGLRKKP
jgi:hypothetical protein